MNRFRSSSRAAAWAGLLTAAAWGVPEAAWGQDALQGTLQGDRAYRQRITPPANLGDYRHIGAFTYFTSLSYGVEWRDNVLNTESNHHADFIHRPHFDLNGILHVSDRSRLQLGFGVGYSHYMNTPGQDRFNIAPNSELAWDITARDIVVTLYDRFTYTEDVLSQGVVTGVASFPRLDNTLGMRATWSPGRFVVSGGYGHETFQSSAAAFNYVNRATENFFERFGYKLAPQSVAGVEATESFTDYVKSIQRDNTSLSFGPYTEWKITRVVNLIARAGVLNYSFKDIVGQPHLATLSSYYGSLEIDHDLTPHIRQRLMVDRRVTQGLNQGGQYIQSSTVNYNISWGFKPRASLTSTVFMEDGTEARAASSEPYKRFGASAAISYEIMKRLAPTLSYSYIQRTSKLAGRGYEVNAVSLYISYRF
ncbi:MAG: outer membrane beta-barrel protein [Verrucomicrobia bacterium]|nr:outer membrane beta-barrel protein [Verrucomicrobiota bacterium]MBI3869728.1 outer membrane beta-barrel protein [Verrucomicrobiota bacterium]